jgi:competence protein CoiA
MQLYAFNFNQQLVSAQHALRQTDYHCLECKQTVRLRGGPYRQRHFYHIEQATLCRQHQKGPNHLALQSYFLQQLPTGDCRLEYPFPSIRRIADVAWLSQKIVIEIQCSPITSEEVLSRNHDYHQLGWKVIWILHDQRYNQVRLSAAEIALRSSPHYFSNMDSLGSGIIYDQFDICENGLRLKRLHPLPLHFREIPNRSLRMRSYPLSVLEQRAHAWNLSVAGDLMNLFLSTPTSDYLRNVVKLENHYDSSTHSWALRHLPFKLWHIGVVTPYQIFFRFLLERMCR